MVPVRKDGNLRVHKNRGEICSGGPPGPDRPTGEKIESKALRYIKEGRVRIIRVMGRTDVYALVQGSDPQNPYEVRFNGQAWWCNCDAHVWRCSHVVAVQLVTGRVEWEQKEESVHDPEIDQVLGPRWVQRVREGLYDGSEGVGESRPVRAGGLRPDDERVDVRSG
jgi:hypothetical protein